MSTPALTPAAGLFPGITALTPKSTRGFRGRKILALVIAVAGVAALIAGLLWNRLWPFTEKTVVEDLAAASDSTVTVRGSRRTYFPTPGCILEGVEFRHGAGAWTLITIDKLTIEGSYLGILRQHVS